MQVIGGPVPVGGVDSTGEIKPFEVDAEGNLKVNVVEGGSSGGGGGSTTTKSATIANTASLSDEIDLEENSLVAISMPATWTTANLTFQAATVSGGTFQNVYDAAGNELTVAAAASRVLTDIPELAPLRFIKIRSGTSGSAVNQSGDRVITLILKR